MKCEAMAEYIAKKFSLLVWRYTIQKLHKTLFLIFHVFSFLFSAGVISRNLIKETHCHNLLMKPFLYFFILFSRDGKSIKCQQGQEQLDSEVLIGMLGGRLQFVQHLSHLNHQQRTHTHLVFQEEIYPTEKT